jgi:hypothetical protein
MSHQDPNYPEWALALPRFYANDEDYITAEGFIKEINQFTRYTAWTAYEKSSWLIGSLRGIAAKFMEELNQFEIKL